MHQFHFPGRIFWLSSWLFVPVIDYFATAFITNAILRRQSGNNNGEAFCNPQVYRVAPAVCVDVAGSCRSWTTRRSVSRPLLLFLKHDSKSSNHNNEDKYTTTARVTWKLRPPLDASFLDQLFFVGSNQCAVWSSRLRRRNPPSTVIFPRGNQAVLLAFVNGRQIGKFGFMTSPGPSVPELEHTVRKLYINKRKTDCPKENDAPVRAAAILYMFVEPEFRGRNIGQQALQIIAYLHRMAGCNYTILIADDKENGRLVRWYERHGYTIAPDLEEMMGTAQGTLGVPMIAPVHHDDELPDGVLLEWW